MGSVGRNFDSLALPGRPDAIEEQLSCWFAALMARPSPGYLADLVDQLEQSYCLNPMLAEAEG